MARINPNETEQYQQGTGADWFALKNHGDVARVQFMIDKYEDIDTFALHKVQIGDKERYVDCLRTYNQSIDLCPLCAAGIPVKPVSFLIMYQHDDGKVKIWERGKEFLAKVQSLANRYAPLSSKVVEIERNGKAGDTKTRYETFMMDNVDPVDLTDIERPELLGGLILSKTVEEMDIFLNTGSFPDGDKSDEPVRRRGASEPSTDAASNRRSATAQSTQAPSSGSRRGATTGRREVF